MSRPALIRPVNFSQPGLNRSRTPMSESRPRGPSHFEMPPVSDTQFKEDSHALKHRDKRERAKMRFASDESEPRKSAKPISRHARNADEKFSERALREALE
jgi:hypothetical protein